jgi:hypothetical protein
MQQLRYRETSDIFEETALLLIRQCDTNLLISPKVTMLTE